jgi:hypothetical protein
LRRRRRHRSPSGDGADLLGPTRPDDNPAAVWTDATRRCEIPASRYGETVLDLHGRGGLAWTHALVAGRYGVS